MAEGTAVEEAFEAAGGAAGALQAATSTHTAAWVSASVRVKPADREVFILRG